MGSTFSDLKRQLYHHMCEQPLQVHTSVLLFTSDGFVVVRTSASDTGQHIECTSDCSAPLSTSSIQQYAHDLVSESWAQACIGQQDKIVPMPTLATVLCPDVHSPVFQFVFYCQVDVSSVDLLHEASKSEKPVFVCMSASRLLELSRHQSHHSLFGLSASLCRIVDLFQPLLTELQKVGKHTARAYPGGTMDVSAYTRHLLADYALLDPILYTFDRVGKGVRSGCVDILARHFAIRDQDVSAMKFCIERFHEASLVIDDIEDQSLLRRDVPCAYVRYGTPLSLNAAYLCVFKMLNDVPRFFFSQHDRTRDLLLGGFVAGHQGQGWDIYWREHHHCPTEAEYISMIRGKTSTPFVMIASLFFLHATDWRLKAVRMLEFILKMALLLLLPLWWWALWLITFGSYRSTFATATDGLPLEFSKSPPREKYTEQEEEQPHWDMSSLIPVASLTEELPSHTERTIAHLFDQIGVFFQVRDDYINLTSEEYWLKKGFCDDLHERKFSFPVIHMVRNKLGRYLDLLEFYNKDEELSEDDLRIMLAYIKETSALDSTRAFLLELRDQISATIRTANLMELDTLVMKRLSID